MAFPSNAVWEHRSSGSTTTNGAAFVSGLGGGSVDYSQQDAPQLTLTDVVCTSGSAVITSVTGGFTSQMVGNGVHLNESGVQNWYWIQTYTSTNQVTLDKNVLGGNNTGVTAHVGGGCNSTVNGIQFAAFIAPGNHIWERGNFSHQSNTPTYTISGTNTNPITVEGYTTVRGDGGFATHTVIGGGADAIKFQGDAHVVRNIKGDAGNTTARAIAAAGWSCTYDNCFAISSLTSTGTGATRWFVTGSNNRFYRCRADGQSNAGWGWFVQVGANGNHFSHCESYGSTELSGFNVAASAYSNRFINCISRDNTGAASDGFTLNDQLAYVKNCTISKNGRDGMRMVSPGGSFSDIAIIANIFNRNGQTSGYEINYSSSDISTNPGAILAALVNVRGNAFYVTGAGKSNNLPPLTGDVTLSGDPFVDSGSGHDFTVNNTAGSGAVIRANSLATTMPGGVGVDYNNLGALATGTSPPPTAPSGLAATVVSSTQINLTWTDNSTDEVYFFVERSVDGGSFSILTVLSPGTTSYSDTEVSPNSTYQYRVRAIN